MKLIRIMQPAAFLEFLSPNKTKVMNMQKLSINNLLIIKNKFKLKPDDSILAYGGDLLLEGIRKENFTELYHIIRPHAVRSSARMNVVRNIKYFRDKVSISSCDEALNFVRLLTAPLLITPMEDYLGAEILIKENFHTDDHLGFDVQIASNDSGYNAVISKADLERIRVHPASCIKGTTFRISRYIYQENNNGLIKPEHGPRANLFLLHEEVTPTGRYRVIKKTLHTYNVNAVKWGFFLGH